MKQLKNNRKLQLDTTRIRLLTREQLVAAPGGIITGTTGGTADTGCAISHGCR